jgi:hypothetical protein
MGDAHQLVFGDAKELFQAGTDFDGIIQDASREHSASVLICSTSNVPAKINIVNRILAVREPCFEAPPPPEGISAPGLVHLSFGLVDAPPNQCSATSHCSALMHSTAASQSDPVPEAPCVVKRHKRQTFGGTPES